MRKAISAANPLTTLLHLATTILLLMLSARTTRAHQTEVAHDGLTSPDALPDFSSISDFIARNCSRFPVGEPVNKERCETPASTASRKKTRFTSQLGFNMTIPKSSRHLNDLIKNISVAFTGSIQKSEKISKVAMLKKVLPGVGNRLLLARTLANTLFLVDSIANSRTLNAGFSFGMCGSLNIIMLNSRSTFHDESILLAFLKNEFASAYMVTTNDCALGFYEQSLRRSSPFLFYKNGSQRVLNTELTLTSLPLEQKEMIKKTFEDLYGFIAAGERLIAMCEGKEPKSERYKALEKLLYDYAPTPFTESIRIDSPDMFITAKNRQPNDIFDVYTRKIANQETTTMYIIRGSGVRSGNELEFTAYEGNPQTLHGKLIGLRRQMISAKEMTLDQQSDSYTGRPELERFHECFSFLEELPQPLLRFLFPSYCDYMTKYTELDKTNQDYCKP